MFAYFRQRSADLEARCGRYNMWKPNTLLSRKYRLIPLTARVVLCRRHIIVLCGTFRTPLTAINNNKHRELEWMHAISLWRGGISAHMRLTWDLKTLTSREREWCGVPNEASVFGPGGALCNFSAWPLTKFWRRMHSCREPKLMHVCTLN